MVAIISYMLLVLAAVVSMLLITIKVQRGLRSMNYISGVRYGKVVQQLQDKYELHRFGFGQYFRRQYGELSIFSIAMNGIGMFPLILLLLATMMQQGGLSVSLFAYCGIGLMFIVIVALIAQYLSAQPTAGGLYHAALRRGGVGLGSIVGGLQLIGQLMLLLGYSIGFVFFLKLLLPTSFSWLHQPGGTAIAVAICLLTQLLVAALKSMLYRPFHIGAWLLQAGGIVLLLICVIAGWRAEGYNGSYLFFANASVTGWFPAIHELEPMNWGLLLALMGRLFIGGDVSAQHAEETVEPKVKVAWSAMLSTCYSFMIGLVLMLVLATLYMNYGYASAGQTGDSWLVQMLGQAPLVGYLVIIAALIGCWTSSVTLVQTGARTLMSMARDGIVPFKASLSMMHYIKQVPQRAIGAVVLFALLLLGSLYYIAAEQLLLYATLLAVVSYCAMYVILFFFVPLKTEQFSIWKMEGWEGAIRLVGMIVLTALMSAAGACLPFSGLLIIAVPLVCIAGYAMLSQGFVSKPLVYDASNGRDLFEMERRMPLQ